MSARMSAARASAGLLGGDVIGRAHHRAHLRELMQGRRLDAAAARSRLRELLRCDFRGKPGQAEVEDLDLARIRDHQVVRLDVAVDHALLVGVLQAQGRLADVVARLLHRQRPAPGGPARRG